MTKQSRLLFRIKQFTPLIILLIVWELLSNSISGFTFRYSNPSSILEAFYLQLTNPKIISEYHIYKSFGLTFSATIVGFILGNLFGSLLGLSLWISENIAKITKPYLISIGAIPIFALAPVLILWFGTGFWAKVAMATFSTILVAAVQAYEGAQNVDENYLRLLKSMGASRSQVLIKLIIPASLIWVFTSYRLNIGFAIIGVFIGEWISSEYGIGHLILRAGGLYDVSLIFVGLICLMIMSLLLGSILNLLEKKVLKWRVVIFQN